MWTDGGLTWRYTTLADLVPMAEMLRSRAVCEHMFFGPNTAQQTGAYFGPLIEGMQEALSAKQPPENLLFTITDSQGRFMGDCALVSVPYGPGNYIAGYQVDEPFWRHGYGTRACEFLVWMGFDRLGAHRLSADCLATNVGSARILETCGFSREGVHRQYYVVDGEFRDNLLFGLLRDEFPLERLEGLRRRFAPSA